MSTKHLLQMLLVFGMVLLAVVAVSAQTSNIFYLKIVDDAGGKDSLVYGNHILGTYGVDATLGENSCPPDPPGFFSKWLSIPGRVNSWGLGLLKKDLRDTLNGVAKKDTFLVYFKNDDVAATNANVTLSWPDQSYLSARCDSMFLVDPTNGQLLASRVDMFAQTSVQVIDPYDPSGNNTGAPYCKLRIYKYGDHPFVDAVKKESPLAPASFALHQNYPNPFNPTTTLKFDIVKSGMTDVSVYNIVGQKIATLVSSTLTPGTYSVEWKATDDRGASVTSGIYFVRMNVHTAGQPDFSAVRKIMLVK